MAMKSFDNVISLPTAQASTRGRTVKPESAAVINDCRDIAVKRITAVLAKTFDTIEAELFDLAEKSIDREKQSLYLDARTQAREKRTAIEAAFRKQFLSFFEQKVSGDGAAARVPSSDYSALSLVNDSELEEKLAMDDIATRLSGKCDDELNALSQRMGFLLAVPEMKEQANPMSPDTVVKALRAACDQMTTGYEAKLTVMKLVEQHMAKEMLGVYHDINAHLIRRQILPQIRPAFRKAQTNITRKNHDVTVPPPSEGIATARAPNAVADIFTTLQDLIAGGRRFDTDMNAGMAVPPEYGATTGGLTPLSPGGRSAGATRNMPPLFDDADQPVTSVGLVSALSQLQAKAIASLDYAGAHEVPAATTFSGHPQNALREIKTSGLASGSSPIDAMTIDIVAMLFDYVFDDKGIPDAIKALLARLQIPVLKVAILDKSFFSRKNHPARRLLDVLADASVSFADGASHDDPLYRKVEEIVNGVQAEFDTDIQIFSQMLTILEHFLLARETANAEMIEQSARALHEREKRELARLIAQDETGRRTQVADLPIPVSAILTGPWTRVLERLYLREGGRSSRFLSALETADNLIWSVTPKADAAQRKQLVSLLPALLKQLQDGMQIAAVERDDCERFFSALVDCHAAAVRAGLRGESVSTLFLASRSSAEIAPLFAKLIAEETAHAAAVKKEATARAGLARIQFTDKGVEIEEISSTSPGNKPITAHSSTCGIPDTSNPTRDPRVELPRGTWVEFVGNAGDKIRAKLSWISPLKGVYLFTNPGAPGALSVSPDALQRQFRDGAAHIIEESSLVDRAVENMVQSLSGAIRA